MGDNPQMICTYICSYVCNVLCVILDDLHVRATYVVSFLILVFSHGWTNFTRGEEKLQAALVGAGWQPQRDSFYLCTSVALRADALAFSFTKATRKAWQRALDNGNQTVDVHCCPRKCNDLWASEKKICLCWQCFCAAL